MTPYDYFENLKPIEETTPLKQNICNTVLTFQGFTTETSVDFVGFNKYKATVDFDLDVEPVLCVTLHNGIDTSGQRIDNDEEFFYINIDDNFMLAMYAMVHHYFKEEPKQTAVELYGYKTTVSQNVPLNIEELSNNE